MRQRRQLAVYLCVAIAAASCTSNPAISSNDVAGEPRLTVRASGGIQRIRFEVNGAHPSVPPDADSTLSPVKRIAAAWRRFAEVELRKRGLCPEGFIGPEVTFWDRSNDTSWFDVECSSPK